MIEYINKLYNCCTSRRIKTKVNIERKINIIIKWRKDKIVSKIYIFKYKFQNLTRLRFVQQ